MTKVASFFNHLNQCIARLSIGLKSPLTISFHFLSLNYIEIFSIKFELITINFILFYFIGALAILNAVYTSDVHKYIYIYVGELLDLLSLINCNIGFVLFCCMSSRYRTTFQETFSPFLYSIFASICRRQFKLHHVYI